MKRSGERADAASSGNAHDPAQQGTDAARVVVSVRIRPIRQDMVVERYDTSCLYCTPPDNTASEAPTTMTIIHPATKEQTDFVFDRVFDEGDSQAALYGDLVEDPLMQTLERSGDLTVVAYGQTGSGKTFTMLGERSNAVMPSSPPTPASSASSTAAAPAARDPASPASLGSVAWLSPDSGVFLRVMNTLMAYRELKSASSHVLIFLHAVEIYNDTFIDLLAKGASSLAGGSRGGLSSGGSMRSHLAGGATGGAAPTIEPREFGENLVLTNVLRVPIDSLDVVQRCFDISHKNRSVSATHMNDASSRSHAIFQIDVVLQQRHRSQDAPTEDCAPSDASTTPPSSRAPDLDAILEYQYIQSMQPANAASSSAPAAGATANNGSFFSRTASEFSAANTAKGAMGQWIAKNPSNDFDKYPLQVSRITLVDLAGSERVKRSGVVGKGMQEAVFVNSSLSTLGLVVHSLCTRQQQATKHIPFRDSKMTRLLRPSFLSPSAKIIFITNISPTSQSYVETLNSMRFASRLKDLRYAPPPQASSGPSLGLLLSDERLQRLRQQMDDMAADCRIYLATWGQHALPTGGCLPVRGRGGPLLPCLRRALVERAEADPSAATSSGGGDRSPSVLAELLCRPPNVKDALQRCRDEWTRAQEAAEKELAAVHDEVVSQLLTSARQSGRINDDDTALTKDHLTESIELIEATLQLSQATCAADIAQWRGKAEAAEAEGAMLTDTLAALSKRKRELYHQTVRKRAELDDLAEEYTLMQRTTQLDAARLVAEKNMLDIASLDEGEASACDSVVAYLGVLAGRLAAQRELATCKAYLDGVAEDDDTSTHHRLVAHELSSGFSSRLASAPLSSVFDRSTVRTVQGRNRILNERLEEASAVFTASPLAYYFTPDVALAPPRYLPWEKARGLATGGDDASDQSDESDDDEAFRSTGPLCVSEEAPRTSHPQSPVAESTKSVGPLAQCTTFYLRLIALYGSLMRVTARAERKRRRSTNTPLLTSSEVRAIFVVLDAVEIDPRVAQDIAYRALRQKQPPQVPSQQDIASPHLLLACERSLWDAIPDVVTDDTRRVLRRLSKLLAAGPPESAPRRETQRFAPCLARCLQTLSLVSLYESLFYAHGLPGDEGIHQERILRCISKQLVRMQGCAETLSDEDTALLKGCQYACRASTGASGGAWSLDDTLDRKRSKLSNTATSTDDPPKLPMPFLWGHKYVRDLSPLRGLAVRCLLCSGLLDDNDQQQSAAYQEEADVDHPPTPARFLECLLIVLRQGGR